MTKINDDDIRSPDPQLKELLSNFILLWNQGKIGFQQISTVPTDSPDDVEIRAFNSGTTYRIYIYFPTAAVWKSVNLS